MVRGLVLCCLVAAVLAVGVSAHNWVGSPSRARFASVTKPCQVRVDNQPHIQVAAGQEFQMEWTVGHGDTNTKTFYWVALHSDDYNQLTTLTTQMLDDYIRLAPRAAYMYNATKWKKRHIGQIGDVFNYGYFPLKSMNATNDPVNFIPRDPVMNRRKYQFQNNKYNEWLFFPNHTQADIRVSYVSTVYPWIESVHKFRNSFAEHNPYAHQFDMATFTVPARKGPGDYIYFFYWGGYRDCVDINVQSTAVTNRYGIYNTSATSSFVKIDHCQYYYVFNPVTQCQVMPKDTLSAQTCLDACKRSGSCLGVQAALATNPANTLPYTPGIPYWQHNQTQMNFDVFPPAILGPCGGTSIHARQMDGCKVVNPLCNATKVRAAADDMVCYGMQPYRDQDFQAIDDYIITNDADDPRFYSTCWVKIANNGFLSVPPPPAPVPRWDVGDLCLDCNFIREVQSLPSNVAPAWTKGLAANQQCVNCDFPNF